MYSRSSVAIPPPAVVMLTYETLALGEGLIYNADRSPNPVADAACLFSRPRKYGRTELRTDGHLMALV
jgi:hypothetical protein